MSEEDIDHVQRNMPPWDHTTLTECGKSDVKGTILTRAEFDAKLRRQGQSRSAMTTCMTCWTTCRNYEPWHVDPADCMRRWLGRSWDGRGRSREAQLRAIAALIQAHRDEFDQFLADLESTTNLAEHRRRRSG